MLVALAPVLALAQPAVPPHRSVQTAGGDVLTPAGRMVAAGDFAAGAVLAPGGPVLTDSTGSQPNTIAAFDPATLTLTGQTYPTAPPSTSEAAWAQTGHLALSPDGKTAYAAGGATGVVEEFDVTPTGLVQTGTVAVPGFAGGIAVSPAGDALFVTLPFDPHDRYDKGRSLARVDIASGTVRTVGVPAVPWDVATGVVAGRQLVAVAARDAGVVQVLDAQSLAPVAVISAGRQPAAPVFTADGKILAVSTLDDTLVAADPLTGRVIASLDVGVKPEALGAAPSAIAVSADGKTVYVANSGENSIAVVARPQASPMRLTGRIPTAAYPTSIVVDGPDRQLLVTDGKGVGASELTPVGTPVVASQQAFNPGSSGLGVSSTLEAIPLPDADTQATYSAEVTADQRRVPASAATTGIKHVLYVIRENKTYDEEFGDMPGGDPSLVMYPNAVTPNAHALANRYVTLTNFYADEEVSDTGHQVLMGSQANDWVQRLSQQAYGLDGAPRQGAELGNGSDLLWSPSNYLLDDALHSGITFRDYGEFYRRDQSQDGPAVTPELDRQIVHDFPGFGFAPDVPDTQRIAYWRKDFAGDVAAGTFPRLEVVYLPEDHTTEDLSGTPQQQVADADLALGQLVDTLSHSPYWSSTLVMMSEDDPQSGLDHVDEHRTLALLAGGRVREGVVADARYDQAGFLRTAELILGLPPLTEHDADAQPLTALLAAGASTTPYDALAPVTPAVPAIVMARLRAEAHVWIPGGERTEDVPPDVQLTLQWAATHHGQRPPER
jgi:DNA-binding beta-propeller fold protein YncE